MSAQVEEVTASAQSLAEMAEVLHKVVAQFKLSTEPQEAARAGKPVQRHQAAFIEPKGNNGYSRQGSVKALYKA